MFRAAIAALAALAAAPAHAAPRRHVDVDAIREVRRAAPERFASGRAIAHYLESRRRLRDGEASRAAEQLRLAVSYDETSPELRVSYAEALALAGQLDRAEGEARRAIELAPAGPTAVDAHLFLGRIAAARRQPDRAVAWWQDAIRLEGALAAERGEPPDPEPWQQMAALHAEIGDEERAVRVLEDLAARAPGDGSGFRELGRTCLERREAGRAERHLLRAVDLDRRDVEALRLLAQAHEALRRTREAREDLLAILRAEPDDANALLALGRLAARGGERAAAREWFLRHARASADAADAHARIVFQWLESGEAAEALEAARAAIVEVGPDPRLRLAEGLSLRELRRWPASAEALAAIRPDAGELFVSARAALADALSRSGRHAEAERAVAAALSTRPDDVRLAVVRATVLERAGRASDGVALLRLAVAERERHGADPELPALYAALGGLLSRSGRPGDAVTVLRGALDARPRDEALLYALGVACERAGNLQAAAAEMRALLVVNPDHAEALNFLGYTFAEQGVRLDEAERLVRRALELRPRSGHVLDSLGWILFKRGEHRRAVEALEQADALAGPDCTILEHLGDAYRAAARPADAAQAYRRALASVPDEIASEQGRRRDALERKLREVAGRSGRR